MDNASAREASSPGNRLQGPFGSTQGRQTPRAFPSDQGLQPRMQHSGLLPQTAQLLRLGQELVIDDQGGSHMHDSAICMQIRQNVPTPAFELCFVPKSPGDWPERYAPANSA